METSMNKMPIMFNMLAPYYSLLSNHFQYHHCYYTPSLYGPTKIANKKLFQPRPLQMHSSLHYFLPISFKLCYKNVSCENNPISFLLELLCILMAKWSSKSIHWEGFLTFQIACPNFRNAKSKVKTFELRILESEEKEMIQMFQNHGVCVCVC